MKLIIRHHFKNCSILLQTDICVGAPIAIEGINIVPEAGLYKGARKTVMDIVYDSIASPNSQHKDHLPLYVVVNFPGLRLGCAKPWDKDTPTAKNRKDQTFVLVYPIHCHAHTGNRKQHVPIPPQEVLCDKGCCVARYCPLILAWTTTVHKFQGFEPGFQQGDLIDRIIASLNNLDWGKCPGAAYVATSRARTIAQSNLFYIGQIGATRFT